MRREIDEIIEYIKSIDDMPWYAVNPIVGKLEKLKDNLK